MPRSDNFIVDKIIDIDNVSVRKSLKEAQRKDFLKATYAQRLAWLEDTITLAWTAKSRNINKKIEMKFLDNFDNDIKQNLLAQMRNLWTHTSTAIEGNSLTLDETAFVIDEGLPVLGKPLKDHQEVVGHAKAIDLIYEMVASNDQIEKDDLFRLHKAIQIEQVVDIYKPVGAWKAEPNGTYTVNDDNQQIYLEYATPDDTPRLMDQWLDLLNKLCIQAHDKDNIVDAYVALHVAFVRIHPFFDGNGRMARLLANLPVLKSGFPPVTISNQHRQEYIRLLAQYELAVGQPKSDEDLLPQSSLLKEFTGFCTKEWEESMKLVEAAFVQQGKRK